MAFVSASLLLGQVCGTTKLSTCRKSQAKPSNLKARSRLITCCASHSHSSQPTTSTSQDAELVHEPRNEEAPFLTAPVPGDEIVRTISANGFITCKAVLATGLVSGSCELFRTTPVAAAALGRALICVLLLSAGKKSNETVNIEFRVNGPIRSIVAVSNGLGEARGYVGNPRVDLPPNSQGKLDVARAVGQGLLAVVRRHPLWKQPYTGMISVKSGEIAEDVATYLLESEQIPSALGAGVYVEGGRVTAAGGYLVELLPGADEESISILERNIANLGMTPTELVRAGKKPAEIVAMIMKDLHPMQLASDVPRYKCSCTIDRLKRTLALIKKEELEDILSKEGRVEAICEFCGRAYYLDPEAARKAHAETATNNVEEADEVPKSS
eukprot:CAMPEP_0184692516 /NCGR_PEP_ID=MMETSP0313-20130426/968_1 /TAXON_ID=2792 /ORGANISM="Porphyridium aerugineum, Strain SAG 1380-2" /LENGTH=383 /DNA_ID=CAMNT_0027150353 /DNA_START=20 /DNA_END=1171 /DNA_ORIENTATION=-